MSVGQFTRHPLISGLEKTRRACGWFLALGILLILYPTPRVAAQCTRPYLSLEGGPDHEAVPALSA